MSQILSYLLSVATKPVAGSRDMTSEMSWKCHGNVMKKLPDISMLMLGVVE
jgi:hypothetical protein